MRPRVAVVDYEPDEGIVAHTEVAIVEPLAASAWSAGFGMLTDRFGVTWSISVS